MITYTQWTKNLQWAPYNYYPEKSLHDALTYRKLTKIEWNKYTISIDNRREGWYDVTITEKYFKPDEKGVIPVIAEREILPDQIDPMILSHMIVEIRGSPFISPEYYWEGPYSEYETCDECGHPCCAKHQIFSEERDEFLCEDCKDVPKSDDD